MRSRRLVATLANLEHVPGRPPGDVDTADALHALLAFLLLFEELALAGNVGAVALGQHVLAHSMNRLASDDLGADRGLDRYPEHLGVTTLGSGCQTSVSSGLAVGAAVCCASADAARVASISRAEVR